MSKTTRACHDARPEYEALPCQTFEDVFAAVRSGDCDLGMLPAVTSKKRRVEPIVARGSTWVRAPESGILVSRLKLGSRVEKGEKIGTISDPLAEDETPIISPTAGVRIGRANLPLMNEGDAIFNLGVFERLAPAASEIDFFQEAHELDS